jgi:EmrB/QacA subfamily drug resistance transporter
MRESIARLGGVPGGGERRTQTIRGPRIAAAPGVILLLVCLGQFLVILDVSVVNVALPSIRHDLGFSADGLQWVVNAYALTFAGFLLLAGRAADLFGRRRLLLAGLALFSLASLIDGLATTQWELVGARALQGFGGAILTPATLTILIATYSEGRARARALGIWSAVAAAGGASGALLGGVITQFLSWRWIFFINLPVGVVVLAAASLVVAETFGDLRGRHLDLWGAISVTGGLSALAWGIARSQSAGWGAPDVLGAFGAGLVLLALFVLIEARLARAPLVPLRLFRSRSVAGANLVSFGLGAALFAIWYFLSLYLQQVRGLTPLAAGLTFVPQTLAIAVGAQVSSRLIPKFGPRPFLVAGPLLATAGLLWLGQISVSPAVWSAVLIPGALLTFGAGLAFPAVTIAATAGVPRGEAGLASGVVNTSRQVGGSLGLAVLATLAADHSVSLAAAGSAAPVALTGGFSLGLLAAAGVAFATAVAGLVVPGVGRPAGRPQRRIEEAQEAAA